MCAERTGRVRVGDRRRSVIVGPHVLGQIDNVALCDRHLSAVVGECAAPRVNVTARRVISLQLTDARQAGQTRDNRVCFTHGALDQFFHAWYVIN